MSWIAIAGASMVGAATLPQAVKLLRTRQAGDFGWAFSVLNVLGLALLAVRSWMIEEWAFLAINAVATAFWGLVLTIKLGTHLASDARISDPTAAPDRRSR